MKLLEYQPLRPGYDYRGGVLKAYAEERRRWPLEQLVRITNAETVDLYAALAEAFGVKPVKLIFRGTGGGGTYHYNGKNRYIVLRYKGVPVGYGSAVHEFAHYLSHRRRRECPPHNSNAFRGALESVYAAANCWLMRHYEPKAENWQGVLRLEFKPKAPPAAPKPEKPARPKFIDRLNARLAPRGYRLVSSGNGWHDFEPLPGFPELDGDVTGRYSERVNDLSFGEWEEALNEAIEASRKC